MKRTVVVLGIAIICLLVVAAGLRFIYAPATDTIPRPVIDEYELKPDPELEVADTITFDSIEVGVPFEGEIEELDNGIITRNYDSSNVWLSKLQTGAFISDMTEAGFSDEHQNVICRFLSRDIDFDACSDDYAITKGIIEAKYIDESELANDEDKRALKDLQLMLLDDYTRFEKEDLKGFVSYGLSNGVEARLFTENDEMYSVIIVPDEKGYVDFVLSNITVVNQ